MFKICSALLQLTFWVSLKDWDITGKIQLINWHHFEYSYFIHTAGLPLITLLDFPLRRLNHPRFNYCNVFGGPLGHLGRQKPSRTQPWHLAGEQNKREKDQLLLFSTVWHSGREVCLHPCRSHQRVFEQTDSRWTPFSTTNQLCFLPFLSPYLSDYARYE